MRISNFQGDYKQKSKFCKGEEAMPLINDEYVDYDPEVLSDAVIQGHTVRPHYNDWESKSERQARHQQEYETISKALKRKDPEAWRRWHEGPKVIQHPDFEWMNTPGLMNRINRDNMASAGPGLAAPVTNMQAPGMGFYQNTTGAAPMMTDVAGGQDVNLYQLLEQLLKGQSQSGGNLYNRDRYNMANAIGKSDRLVSMYG